MVDLSETPDDRSEPFECRATAARIQSALDHPSASELLLTAAATHHATECGACRERIAAARLLAKYLAAPREVAAVPISFTHSVLAAVEADRRAEPSQGGIRKRAVRAGAWAALAAALVIGVHTLIGLQDQGAVFQVQTETAQPIEIAPPPKEKLVEVNPPAVPPPPARPTRIGDEFAKAGQAILAAPKPLVDSVSGAPRIIEAFAGPFEAPRHNEMVPVLEPARRSIAEFPVAARTSFEPVTGTAEKAFQRFLRDVGAVKPNS
jgi:hypothetical protein